MIGPDEPEDDEYDVLETYDDPNADTVIFYDENENQHVEVRGD